MIDEEGPLTSWPDVPRVCFTHEGPPGYEACLSWCLGSGLGERAYVEGYRRAAESFYEHATRCQRMSPDYVVFPLAFLWRHHLELALKDIISTGQGLAGEEADFPKRHNLLQLWRLALPYVVVQGDPNAPELDNVASNIKEFERIDPQATGFRYLQDKKGNGVGLADPPSTVNIATMQEAMVAVSNFLDAVHSCQGRALDWQAEQAAMNLDYGGY